MLDMLHGKKAMHAVTPLITSQELLLIYHCSRVHYLGIIRRALCCSFQEVSIDSQYVLGFYHGILAINLALRVDVTGSSIAKEHPLPLRLCTALQVRR